MLPRALNSIVQALFVTALLSSSAIAQSGPKSSSIRNVVHQGAKGLFASNPGQIGLSVGIFKDGKVSTYNFGWTAKGSRHKPTAHTLYCIASMTKTFTSTLLAQAVVEHRLRLEDDVRKYLKGEFPNLEFQGKPIELQYLTNHRSGLPFLLPDKPEGMPDYKGDGKSWSRRVSILWKGYTRQDFYSDLSQVKLPWTPNSRSTYSNAALQLLGYILEAKYGKSYENLVKEKIARPLDMTDTTISLSAEQINRLAKGYDEDGQLFAMPDVFAGAGALKTTVADLMKYLRWEISENDPAVKLSHRPVFTVGDYSAGLNWQMMKKGNRRLIWQSGSFPGFKSLLVMEPGLRLGLVLLSNQQDDASSRNYLQDMANQVLKSLDTRAIPLP